MNEDTTTGATPGIGATPVQAGPEITAPAEPTPATGEDDLGEAGKKVLRETRSAARDATARAEAAEKELADLRSATQTDHEKALAQARSEAAAEVTERMTPMLRAIRVESALVTAGVDPTLIDLAARADEFSVLKVNDKGEVEGVTEAVAALKKTRPSLFAPATAGTVTQGVQTPKPDVAPGYDRLSQAYANLESARK